MNAIIIKDANFDEYITGNIICDYVKYKYKLSSTYFKSAISYFKLD